MVEEMAVGRAARSGVLVRALTPVIKQVGRRLLRWTPVGSIVAELPTGQVVRFGHRGTGPEPVLRLHNYRVVDKAIRRGAIGFSESYIDGDIDCDDLTGVMRFFLANIDRFERSGRHLFKARLGDRLAHLMRRNSRRGSRRNISEHYDLGNDFYRLWLDEGMNYSSALFADDRTGSLEAAQLAKLDLILDMAELSGNEHILEIGSGWGALAGRAAERGVRVTGLTLSHEQLDYARRRATQAGLGAICDFRLQDYRDERGQYDRIVSIEMIEAVGEENWPRYFGVLHDRLKPGGSAVIQSITIDERRFQRYRSKADFIQRYIFPGGMLPTRTIIEDEARKAGLALDRIETFGRSYARTLREWRERFDAAWPRIAELGFDPRFRRKWIYYLAYCEAGFLEGTIDVGAYRLRKV